MSYRSWLLTRLDRHLLSVAVRIATLAALLLTFSHAARASVADEKGPSAAPPCGFSDAEFDTATDVRALEEYRDAIAQLLKQEKFAELDCLADAARTGKTRFPGGAWNLRNIYGGLETPRPGHPTEEDWHEHLDLVERWVSRNPRSMTATIALSESYTNYGWSARGDGFADSVSDSGWKLLGERLAKAKAILDEHAALATKCPEWYTAMQKVVEGQNWPRAQAEDLLQRAIAFEPGYQYYYRTYGSYLLPKWSGQDGDTTRFAEETANRVGGEAGDILYFQIAEAIRLRLRGAGVRPLFLAPLAERIRSL